MQIHTQRRKILARGMIVLFAFAGLVRPTFGVVNLLSNSGFEDVNTDGVFGDGWGSFFNADFNDFFGGDAHASLFGDFAGNSGGVYQTGIIGTNGVTFQLDLMNTRIEANWDANLLLGLEFYAADDTTKLGETLVPLDTSTRLSNGTQEGNVFSMQGQAVPGTRFVRPLLRFDNVNATYAGQTQASLFVFDSFMSIAPSPGDEYLKNAAFADLNGDGSFGDSWGGFGNVDFSELFGPGNPHASLFADLVGNAGGIFQQAVLATPGSQYRFSLPNVRIEQNFDADLFFGLEYYAADDFTKLGESIVSIDTTTTGDGLSFSMIGVPVTGTVYVRPVVRFDNVLAGGTLLRNAFIFEASLTELAPGVDMLANPGFLDVDTNGVFGDFWGKYFNVDFNDFWGGNPHASFFGDFTGNSGGIFQQGIAGLPGSTLQLDLLDTRIEPNWDADLLFGFEYYAADDATKIGETLTMIDAATRIANGTVDGNVFSMQAVIASGAFYVRPIVKFENVNATYAAQPQANIFIFDTFMGLAPAPGDQYLKNPAFFDANGDGTYGDLWGKFGATDFNAFFGAGNPHASFFADQVGNTGMIFQQAVLGTPGARYQFDLLDVRLEQNFDADLFFGLEYYGADDFTKLGETIIPIDTSVTGDGLSFSVTGTMVAGAVYVRPVVFFDNVGSSGGSQRSAFVFAAALTELPSGDFDGDGDVDLADYAQFANCLTGPDNGPAASGCETFDFDSDNDVDLSDFEGFQRAFTG